MFRNHEGYPDPTAGQALANIAREEKRAEAARRRAMGLIPEESKKATHKKLRKQCPKIEVMRW